jgi:hypothetical protein
VSTIFTLFRIDDSETAFQVVRAVRADLPEWPQFRTRIVPDAVQPEHHPAESVAAETLTVGTALCESHALIFASDVVVDLPGVITPHRSVPP